MDENENIINELETTDHDDPFVVSTNVTAGPIIIIDTCCA